MGKSKTYEKDIKMGQFLTEKLELREMELGARL